jgi:hypothetical protein
LLKFEDVPSVFAVLDRLPWEVTIEPVVELHGAYRNVLSNVVWRGQKIIRECLGFVSFQDGNIYVKFPR